MDAETQRALDSISTTVVRIEQRQVEELRDRSQREIILAAKIQEFTDIHRETTRRLEEHQRQDERINSDMAKDLKAAVAKMEDNTVEEVEDLREVVNDHLEQVKAARKWWMTLVAAMIVTIFTVAAKLLFGG